MGKNNSDVTGSCLCGAVQFSISGPLRSIVACHCGQCQRTHGHYAAYTRCLVDDLTMIREDGLKWYRSSESATRGFCGECGASLFWRPAEGNDISVAAGSLDDVGELKLIGHIFCDDMTGYYTLEDELPKFPKSSGGSFDDFI